MRTIGWNILTFAFALTSAQGPKECSSPLEYPNIRLSSRYRSRNKFSSGDKVYYNCAEGFTPLAGSRAVACIRGTWTRLTLKCEKKSCGYAGDLLHGQLHYEGNSYLGEKVYATCNEGYTVKGQNYMICQASGWTGEFPTCEGKPCGSAGEIVNGRFVYSGAEFGDTATAVCDEGYILVGEVRRNCMSNGWDGRIPVCEAVNCDDPPVVKNAEMKGPQEPPYNYRTVISYQCRVGTLIGQKEINCTKNGTWSTPPECHENICLPPNVTNAFWMRAQNRFFQHQDTILIECRLGYVMNGPNSITCNNDGQWYPRLPKCQEILCPPPNVANAFWRAQNRFFRHQDTISIKCRPGYMMKGPDTITCNNDGQWIPRLPECRRRSLRQPYRRGQNAS